MYVAELPWGVSDEGHVLTTTSFPLPESAASFPVPALSLPFSFPIPKASFSPLFAGVCTFPLRLVFADLLELLVAAAFLSAAAECLAWLKSFHLRQPSKSMRACMQPHSITLRVSHSKFTGYMLLVTAEKLLS